MNLRCVLPALLISLSALGQSIPSGNSDTVRVYALLALSKKSQWINPDQSLTYADEALTLARELQYNRGIAIANTLKGFCYWTFGDNDLAIEAAMEALEISKRENYRLIEAESYYILARGYMDVRETAKAKEAIEKAEELALEGKDWEQVCSIYNLKGVILFIENKTDSALHFYTKALETGRSHAVDSINFPADHFEHG
jgi:tetratricopeptide (TPR) repeat protein